MLREFEKQAHVAWLKSGENGEPNSEIKAEMFRSHLGDLTQEQQQNILASLFDRIAKLSATIDWYQEALPKANTPNDFLTGIPGPAAIDRKISEYSSKLNSQHNRQTDLKPHVIAVFKLDLRGFKKFNDEHDYETGDCGLKATSEVLKKLVREEDFIGRIGGDEFVIIVECSDESDLKKFEKRLNDAFSNVWIESHAKPDTLIKLEIVYGYALAAPGDDSQNLMSKADYAYKKAKNESFGDGRGDRLNFVLQTMSVDKRIQIEPQEPS